MELSSPVIASSWSRVRKAIRFWYASAVSAGSGGPEAWIACISLARATRSASIELRFAWSSAAPVTPELASSGRLTSPVRSRYARRAFSEFVSFAESLGVTLALPPRDEPHGERVGDVSDQFRISALVRHVYDVRFAPPSPDRQSALHDVNRISERVDVEVNGLVLRRCRGKLQLHSPHLGKCTRGHPTKVHTCRAISEAKVPLRPKHQSVFPRRGISRSTDERKDHLAQHVRRCLELDLKPQRIGYGLGQSAALEYFDLGRELVRSCCPRHPEVPQPGVILLDADGGRRLILGRDPRGEIRSRSNQSSRATRYQKAVTSQGWPEPPRSKRVVRCVSPIDQRVSMLSVANYCG